MAQKWAAALPKGAFAVYAPAAGRVFPLTESVDPAHQQEALGKGVCIIPKGGKITAPFDGVVSMVFDTKHALGLTADNGVELLIHCGIDTVKLGGEGFITHVTEGERVKKGALLLEYDESVITKAGLSLETQIVVTNTDEWSAVTPAASGDVDAGAHLLTIGRHL